MLVFEKFEQEVHAHGLVGVWNLKALVTGDELTRLTGVPAGPQFKHLLELVIDHQLEFPAASAADVEHWLKTVVMPTLVK